MGEQVYQARLIRVAPETGADRPALLEGMVKDIIRYHYAGRNHLVMPVIATRGEETVKVGTMVTTLDESVRVNVPPYGQAKNSNATVRSNDKNIYNALLRVVRQYGFEFRH